MWDVITYSAAGGFMAGFLGGVVVGWIGGKHRQKTSVEQVDKELKETARQILEEIEQLNKKARRQALQILGEIDETTDD